MKPAPVNSAGIPIPHSTTQEVPSLPAMSVQEDGTNELAIAPREGEAIMPLTEPSLAMLGLDDPRRRMAGTISEWDYVSSPTHAHAPLAWSQQP